MMREYGGGQWLSHCYWTSVVPTTTLNMADRNVFEAFSSLILPRFLRFRRVVKGLRAR
jgi:hypothetical protein